MVTKEQLQKMNGHGELHYTGHHDCTYKTGPRGGIKLNITAVRLSGKIKVWVRTPHKFRQPVKFGLYDSYKVDETNARFFHSAEDCEVLHALGNEKKGE